MRTSTKGGPHCIQRVAKEVSGDATSDSQLAVLDCTYDVVKRECPQGVHADLLIVMSEMLVGELLARAQRE